VGEFLAVERVALVGVVGNELAFVLSGGLVKFGYMVGRMDGLTEGRAPKLEWHRWWCWVFHLGQCG
jgi:hypothetical protein